MDNRPDYKRFNEYLNGIPLEELQKENDAELDKTAKDFEDFKNALAAGKCSFCGNPITHFSVTKPCFHWLLKPNGFKTRHFPLLFKEKSFHHINPYLRWVANSESPIRNINDLAVERSPSKVVEETIRYRNLEWSFSCTDACMRGETHKNKEALPLPHYHFQMKVNGNVVISYGQFHVPFSEYDHFCFAVARGEFDRLKGGHIEGAGMQAMYEHFSPEELLDSMVSAKEDGKKAQFNTQTLVIADEGTTISGEDLASLFEEHKRTGIPMAKLIQKLKNVTAETYITPGPGVPEIATRKPGRRKKK